MTVREIGEYGLVAHLCERLERTFGIDRRVLVGLGDDAAVVELDGLRLVLTIDTQLENTHFRLRWMPPKDLGWKAVAISLSDLAAMGAKPLAVLFGIGLTGDEPLSFVDDLYEGATALCQATQTLLLGGDTTRSSLGVLISSVAIGVLEGEPWRRQGAQVGDALLVTGYPGEAAAGFWLLEKELQAAIPAPFSEPCLKRFRSPLPRTSAVPLLRSFPIHAAIDLSDGLAIDAWRIAAASKVWLQLEISRLPISDALRSAAQAVQKEPLDLALTGGEDYELLLAVPMGEAEQICQRLWEHGIPAHLIGTVIGTDSQGQVIGLFADGTVQPLKGGFQHF